MGFRTSTVTQPQGVRLVVPRWELFAGITLVATIAVLVLARTTQQTLTQLESAPSTEDAPPESSPGLEANLSTPALLVNVALSHGLLGSLLVATVWYGEIPPGALGIAPDVTAAIGPGIALGVGLYVANEAAAMVATRFDITHNERLRELLAPDSTAGWVVLLGGVLPLIAVVEELLFRAALIGGLAVGFGLPVWGLAVVSSVAFGIGHGLQGPGGVLVTGGLGFVLAAAFILSGSLAVVVIAHYLINALEFVVHEGLGISWSQ